MFEDVSVTLLGSGREVALALWRAPNPGGGWRYRVLAWGNRRYVRRKKG